MGNWNVISLNKKEQELVWETEQYHIDIVGISYTKCRGSDIDELNEGWKLFYSGVDVTMSAQVGVDIFVSPRLAHCVTDWIPLGRRVCLKASATGAVTVRFAGVRTKRLNTAPAFLR